MNTPAAAAAGTPAAAGAGAQPNPFAQMAAMMGGQGMGGGMGNFGQGMGGFGQQGAFGQPAVQPAIVYREQLAQLNAMGFTNAEQNIRALVNTGGNIEAAVDRLISGL